jgi:hypothetical protein
MKLKYPSQQEIRHLFHYEDGQLINKEAAQDAYRNYAANLHGEFQWT